MSLFGTFAELRHASPVSGHRTPRAFKVLFGKIWKYAIMMGSLGSLLAWVAPLGRLQNWCF